jgi:hypothetical protein
VSGIALALFLLTFFIVPVGGLPLYEHAWRHRQPDPLSHLVIWRNGGVYCNGAYYLEMLVAWTAFLCLAALTEWVMKKDDPAWEGLFSGFGRKASLLLVDGALVALCAALMVWCLANERPIHGPLVAVTAIVGTLVVAPIVGQGIGRKTEGTGGLRPSDAGEMPIGGRKGGCVSAEPDDQQPADEAVGPAAPPPAESAALPIQAEARPLNPMEPGSVDVDAVKARVLETVVLDGAPRIAYRKLTFTPPPPPSSLLPPDGPQTVNVQMDRIEYIQERAKPRPTDLQSAAAQLALAARQQVVMDVANQAAGSGDREPSIRVARIVALAASLPEKPGADGHVRYPMECLHDGTATVEEKSWLAAALLAAIGTRAAIWAGPGFQTAQGVGVANLYEVADEQAGGGRHLRDEAAGVVWSLYPLDGSSVSPRASALFELPLAGSQTAAPL